MRYYLSFALLAAVAFNSFAQSDYPYPALSPIGKITQQIGTTLVEVNYERPSVRKRQIFGELVPWNKVWRTGAGYSTKVRFSKRVVVEGQNVPPGYYSLFTIPNPESWIIILNQDTTLYGSSFYNPKLDVARFVIIPTKTERHYEALTMEIDLIRTNGKFYILWANTQLSFDIVTSTEEETMRFINNEVASNKATDANLYAGAAEYLLYQGQDLYQALVFANKALQLDKDSWAGNVRVKLLETLGYYDEAIKSIQQDIDAAKRRKYEREKDRQDKIEELENVLARIRSKQ